MTAPSFPPSSYPMAKLISFRAERCADLQASSSKRGGTARTFASGFEIKRDFGKVS
jgi:hypothetical protein